MSAKIEGFAKAGATIEVVTPDEVQTVIDKAHMAKFGEAREATDVHAVDIDRG